MLRKFVLGLAGVFVAWLLFRPRQPLIYIPEAGPGARRTPALAPDAGVSAPPAPVRPAQAPAEPAADKKPTRKRPPAVPDDLTLLDGIGPKIAAALVAAGVDSFATLANAEPENVERIVREAGVRMVGHADAWLQQAALAARGDMDGLERLKAELRSRRRSREDE
ncbi:MAG: hypothetical protein IT323_02615 [Anaerolineae bacterium]|nr:hypothetical protein [Anaerolineae bacterium]